MDSGKRHLILAISLGLILVCAARSSEDLDDGNDVFFSSSSLLGDLDDGIISGSVNVLTDKMKEKIASRVDGIRRKLKEHLTDQIDKINQKLEDTVDGLRDNDDLEDEDRDRPQRCKRSGDGSCGPYDGVGEIKLRPTGRIQGGEFIDPEKEARRGYFDVNEDPDLGVARNGLKRTGHIDENGEFVRNPQMEEAAVPRMPVDLPPKKPRGGFRKRFANAAAWIKKRAGKTGKQLGGFGRGVRAGARRVGAAARRFPGNLRKRFRGQKYRMKNRNVKEVTDPTRSRPIVTPEQLAEANRKLRKTNSPFMPFAAEA